GAAAAYPAAVVARLERGVRGEVRETPKPAARGFERPTIRVIGSRRDAMAGAAAHAATLGYEVVRLDDPVVGEARDAGVSHVRAVLARAADVRRPACFVSSGETIVRVSGQGRGGRNQEFALAAAEPLAHAGGDAMLASAGTDGIDGPTDAAGAVADSTTLQRARSARLDPARFLADNDSYAFFDALGDLVRTGPTGTNVGDLQVILLACIQDVFTRSRARSHARTGAPPCPHARAAASTQGSARGAHQLQTPHQVARLVRRSHSDSRTPVRSAGKNGPVCRPAADAPGWLRLRHARAAARQRRRHLRLGTAAERSDARRPRRRPPPTDQGRRPRRGPRDSHPRTQQCVDRRTLRS